MTAYPGWTPAPRAGIVPLRPLGFGTILGKSFAALRQNPRVLLGFAVGVQGVMYLILAGAVVGVSVLTFSRLDTLRYGSEDFDTIFAGSIAIVAIVAGVLGLAASAVSVVVQGVVVAEVAHEVVAEKLSTGPLWRRVKPVFWRLLGYSFLLALAFLLGFALIALAVVGAAVAHPLAAFAVAVPLILASIPLVLWLSTKLFVVPAVIVIEHARVFPAIARSWRLTRGRFWPTLGIIVVISVIMGVLAQAVSIPFSVLSTGLSTVFAPTGDLDTAGVIGIVVAGVATQVLTLLIQAITLVVQATSSTLVYVDSRMRAEGLDLDLLAYVERRDAGERDLADPYLQNIGARRAVPPAGWYAPGPPGYPTAPAYAAPGYPPGAVPTAAPPTWTPPNAAAPASPAVTPPADDPTPSPSPPPTPSPTEWAAPGAPPSDPPGSP